MTNREVSQLLRPGHEMVQGAEPGVFAKGGPGGVVRTALVEQILLVVIVHRAGDGQDPEARIAFLLSWSWTERRSVTENGLELPDVAAAHSEGINYALNLSGLQTKSFRTRDRWRGGRYR